MKIFEANGLKIGELFPPRVFNLLNKPGYGQYRETYQYKRYLNIEIFDNTEYDCRNAEEWLQLGRGKPVPALACYGLSKLLKIDF